MKKTVLISLLIVMLGILGCKQNIKYFDKVVPFGPNTYTLSMGHANPMEARKIVYKRANEYCQSINKVFIIKNEFSMYEGKIIDIVFLCFDAKDPALPALKVKSVGLDSLGKEQQKRKELEEVVESLKALKEIEEPRNKIATLKAVDSPLKDQQKTQDLKEAKEKVKEDLQEIEKLMGKSVLLKEEVDTQEIKQNNEAIETLSATNLIEKELVDDRDSEIEENQIQQDLDPQKLNILSVESILEDLTDKDDKNIVQAKSDKKIDNTKKVIKKLKVDSQYASRTTYTIQIGSHIRKTDAQKQFNSIIGSLDKINLNLFRIEKVGKYYTVRLGKFEGYSSAVKLIKKIKPHISNAFILEAYIKNERIIRSYGDE